MKSLLSLILACLMTASLFVSSASASVANAAISQFTDVSENDWFYDNVKYVCENGIMKGVSDVKFAPEDDLSRAMSVTILYRMAGEPDVSKVQHSFKDVKGGEWYSDAVLWAYENGITKGRSDAEFAPNDNVTRAEFTVFLTRYAYYAELELPSRRTGEFADSMFTPDYAKDAEKLMYESEVLRGQPGNMFYPYAYITRAEAAAMLERLVNNSEKIDPEEYTYVVFIGNSVNGSGNIPIHFKALADDEKIKVYSYDHSENARVIIEHYEWFSSNKHPDTRIAEIADIFIMQEGGGSFPCIGENVEISNMIKAAGEAGTLPGGFANGFCRGENEVGKLVDLLGHDKKYYTFTAAPRYGIFDENDTEMLLRIKEIFAEQYDLPLVYVSDVATFNEDLGLSSKDTFPDGLHPTRLMGYCAALALYCEIYDVPAAEQNNGDLKYDEIPGDTQAEKDAFMAKLKDTVQAILDVQK